MSVRSCLPMSDPLNRKAAVVSELVTVSHEHLSQPPSALELVPTLAEQRPGVGDGLVEACVSVDHRVADECHVRPDAELDQHHEQVAEPWDRRKRRGSDPVAK